MSKGGRRRRLYYLYIFIALLASKKKKKEKGNLYLVGAPHLLLYFFNSREGVASIGRPPPLQVPTLSLTAGTFAVYLLKKKIYIYNNMFSLLCCCCCWLVGLLLCSVSCQGAPWSLLFISLLNVREGGGGGKVGQMGEGNQKGGKKKTSWSIMSCKKKKKQKEKFLPSVAAFQGIIWLCIANGRGGCWSLSSREETKRTRLSASIREKKNKKKKHLGTVSIFIELPWFTISFSFWK